MHFDKRHPRDFRAAQVEAFLTYFDVEGRVAANLAQSILAVQELLGHKDVTTTMIYTHVLNKRGKDVTSPLDIL